MAQAELIRVRSSFIRQGLWGRLLAALHLAAWQMLALMGTHREGGFTDLLSRYFSGRGWEWGTEAAQGCRTGSQSFGLGTEPMLVLGVGEEGDYFFSF